MTCRSRTVSINACMQMAPEVWRGVEADIDHRCDIFAMGVCLFQLLSGQFPWKLKPGEPRRNLIGKVLYSSREAPSVK